MDALLYNSLCAVLYGHFKANEIALHHATIGLIDVSSMIFTNAVLSREILM
jgi:hypothetical protein